MSGMIRSLSPKVTRGVSQRLKKANRLLARRYPGETGRRQPVHTVYGGAHLFKAAPSPNKRLSS